MTGDLSARARALGEPEAVPTDSVATTRLFAQINRKAAPMLGLAALGTVGFALSLIGAQAVVVWAAFIGCAIVLVYALPIAFLDSVEAENGAAAWRRKFVLATAFCGCAWAYLVVALLRSPEPDAPAFAILIMLLASTVMSLLSATIPGAFVAGMLPMIVGVVLAYPSRLLSGALPAAMAIGVIGYLLAIVQRLHAAAARSISLQAEKDSLIAELEQAKLNSDESRRRAESANLAKSRFLATMSHELRTPLNAILGFSEVMKGELFGPHGVAAYKEYSNDIHVSGQQLLVLINEILDLSRVEAGRYDLKEESLSLPAIVEDCRRLLSMRAKSRNLTITDTLRRGSAADLGRRTGRAPDHPEPAHQRHQVHAARGFGGDQSRLDRLRRSVRLDQGHRPRDSGGRDPGRPVVVRTRLARAQERGGGERARAPDRQGPRRTSRRPVPPDVENAGGHGGGRHFPARARRERAACARRRSPARIVRAARSRRSAQAQRLRAGRVRSDGRLLAEAGGLEREMDLVLEACVLTLDQQR